MKKDSILSIVLLLLISQLISAAKPSEFNLNYFSFEEGSWWTPKDIKDNFGVSDEKSASTGLKSLKLSIPDFSEVKEHYQVMSNNDDLNKYGVTIKEGISYVIKIKVFITSESVQPANLLVIIKGLGKAPSITGFYVVNFDLSKIIEKDKWITLTKIFNYEPKIKNPTDEITSSLVIRYLTSTKKNKAPNSGFLTLYVDDIRIKSSN